VQYFVSTVTVLSCDSRRLCAVCLENDEWKLLIICIYLPYEDGYANIDAFS